VTRSRTLIGVIVLLVVIIAALAAALVYFARDEIRAARGEGKPATGEKSRASIEDGVPIVKLNARAQSASGVATRPLAAHTLTAERRLYGGVVGVQGLVEARARWLAAQNDARVVRAALARSSAEVRRMRALYRDEQTVSQRALQTAESDWKSDQAKLAAAETAAVNLQGAMRQEWGAALTGWATQNANAYARLARGDDVLLQLVADSGGEAAAMPAALEVTQVGAKSAPRQAQFVSVATRADPALTGRTYWYRAPAGDLRVGMRVEASLSSESKGTAGVLVPPAALVWHAGKAWIYLKREAEEFARREVATDAPAGEDWFSTAFKPGEEVVVSGAQLLLSEEFRDQIKNENED
jgi:hypothetical protein